MSAKTTERKTKHGEFINRELKRLRHSPFVKIGVLAADFSETKKTDGENESVKTLGEVAVYNEFGTSDGRIPERSFIRYTHDNKKGEWIRRTNTLRKRLMQGKIDTEKGLGLMGEMIETDIKDRIMSNIQPANKPSTIAAKTRDGNAGDKTLIDTGQLLGSIHWSVSDGRNK